LPLTDDAEARTWAPGAGWGILMPWGMGAASKWWFLSESPRIVATWKARIHPAPKSCSAPLLRPLCCLVWADFLHCGSNILALPNLTSRPVLGVPVAQPCAPRQTLLHLLG